MADEAPPVPKAADYDRAADHARRAIEILDEPDVDAGSVGWAVAKPLLVIGLQILQRAGPILVDFGVAWVEGQLGGGSGGDGSSRAGALDVSIGRVPPPSGGSGL